MIDNYNLCNSWFSADECVLTQGSIYNLDKKDKEIRDYYVKLKNPPTKLKEAYDQLTELYFTYTDFYAFVKFPPLNKNTLINEYNKKYQNIVNADTKLLFILNYK